MSKLPNAPLIEVIFELRWKIKVKDDLTKVQYLPGDLYSTLKEKYPFRESLVPTEIPLDVFVNQPIQRFRNNKGGYPLCQVGPGLITLNTIDKDYFWDTFYKSANDLLDSFIELDLYETTQKFSPNLIYLDFFPFDFNQDNVNDFLNEQFNITFKQDFIESGRPDNVDLGFFYKVKTGKCSVTFKRGKNSLQQDGIVMQTKLVGSTYTLEKENLLAWLSEAHEFCSSIFKKLTAGNLYESFK
jgi:uncharacterized protein (TIGR04255 family)